jgi:hypothetical protein
LRWEFLEKKIKKRKNYDKDKEGAKKVHSSIHHPSKLVHWWVLVHLRGRSLTKKWKVFA